MRMWTKLLILAALVSGVVVLSKAVSETSAAAAKNGSSATLDGRWEGKMNGLPAVKLNLAVSHAKPTGTVTFYLIKHAPDGTGAHVDGDATEPIENAKLEGSTLTFDVHRSDGSVARFRVELKENNTARLFRTNDDPPSPQGEGLELTRIQ
jgi:hypothetical protein